MLHFLMEMDSCQTLAHSVSRSRFFWKSAAELENDKLVYSFKSSAKSLGVTLATILARMSARMSVSVSWNAALIANRVQGG